MDVPNTIFLLQCCTTCAKDNRLVESTGVAASLGGGGASGGLEPLDELVDGEGLGEGRAVVAS